MKLNLTAAIAFGLAICAGQAEAASERDNIEAACRTQAIMMNADCGCVADHAMTNFSDHQREWLLASARQDQAAAMKAQSQMSQQEVIEIGTFMATAMQTCPP